MIKEIYLVRDAGNETYAGFTERILQVAAKVSEKEGITGVNVVYTAALPPAVSIIPFKKKKAATLSVYRTEHAQPLDILTTFPGFSGAYSVEEALPVQYHKTWPDGEQTPGACLLTLFNRRKGLDHQTFLHRWHNSHTPLSLKIHPLWNYNRNVVESRLTENAEPWEGIVEEQVREDRDLLNPFRFFGNPLVIIPRMISVYTDTKSFLDYNGIETYLARERVIKNPASTKMH